MNAVWNGDFHHSSKVALTGRREAYLYDYRGQPQEFVSAAKYGYLFQGQRYNWQNKARGKPARDLLPANFVHFLDNHDQIANSASGKRIHQLTSGARLRAMMALLILGPQTPMLFQGQEFSASTPFLYFSDAAKDNSSSVRDGRLAFLWQFASYREQQIRRNMPDPCDRSTFERCKLAWDDAGRDGDMLALHTDLIALRRCIPVVGEGEPPAAVDGSVLSDRCLLLRYLTAQGKDDRLLLINLGRDLVIASLADPLFAPPEFHQWTIVWSSEDVRYGGGGQQRPADLDRRWVLPGNTALLLTPEARGPQRVPSAKDVADWQEHLIG